MGGFFPGRTHFGQEMVSGVIVFCPGMIAPIHWVVPNGRSGEENSWRALEAGKCCGKQFCAFHSAFSDAVFFGLGPPALGDTFTGQMNDSIHPFQGGT